MFHGSRRQCPRRECSSCVCFQAARGPVRDSEDGATAGTSGRQSSGEAESINSCRQEEPSRYRPISFLRESTGQRVRIDPHHLRGLTRWQVTPWRDGTTLAVFGSLVILGHMAVLTLHPVCTCDPEGRVRRRGPRPWQARAGFGTIVTPAVTPCHCSPPLVRCCHSPFDRASRPRDPRRVARPPGLEPGTVGLEVRCSIQLSYGRNLP